MIVETLIRLQRYDLDAVKLETREAVLRHIDAQRGTARFVELVEKFAARQRLEALLELALERFDQALGAQAASLLVKLDGVQRVAPRFNATDADSAAKAVRVFGATQDPQIIALLADLAADVDRPVSLRREAVMAMGRGPAGERRLLERVTAGKLPQDLHFAAANVLLVSRDEQVRREAGKFLSLPATRSGMPLPPVAELAQRRGDPARGKLVYIKATCITCHKIGELGIDFGPNLSEIGDKLPREALYESILAPSAAISFGYEGYLLTLRQAPAPLLGYIASETDEQVTVRQMGGVVTTLDKSSIVERRRQETSLMTANLERIITEQELVDLVEYLTTLRKPVR